MLVFSVEAGHNSRPLTHVPLLYIQGGVCISYLFDNRSARDTSIGHFLVPEMVRGEQRQFTLETFTGSFSALIRYCQSTTYSYFTVFIFIVEMKTIK